MVLFSILLLFSSVQQVVEEDRQSKLPKNYERRAARAQWEIDYEKRKEVCLAFLNFWAVFGFQLLVHF